MKLDHRGIETRTIFPPNIGVVGDKASNMFDHCVATASGEPNEFTDQQFPTGLELFHEELRPAFALNFSSQQTLFTFFIFHLDVPKLEG
jgi:hypothetical protein